MRFLHCADLHIGCFSDVAEGIQCLDFLAEAALAGKAQAMLIAGDLFDKAAPYPYAARRAVEPLSRLADCGVRVYAVEGNHDCEPDGAFRSLRYLEERGLIHVLRPAWDASGGPVLDTCVAECHKIRIVGLGFLGDQTAQRLRAFVDALPDYKGATVCLLHTGVYEEGRVPPGGVTEQEIAYCAKKIQYIALGHRHGREEHGIAFNPGSPTGVRLNDMDADYGYYLADIGAGSGSIAFFFTRN
ncbi:MAG TPA: metallophosphoesterase [Feifaniaceae bacterium]|nr:metallophosphoesterase [Feifaniaceae bacterium]